MLHILAANATDLLSKIKPHSNLKDQSKNNFKIAL